MLVAYTRPVEKPSVSATSGTKLARVHRGVRDSERAGAFFGWLFGVEAEIVAGGVRIPCTNGELVLVDSDKPVSIEWEADGLSFCGDDPDGVAVATIGGVSTSPSSMALDHVRLNCADLEATVEFYRRLGLGLTWAGGPGGETLVEGHHERLVAGADWVHVSAADGYLSLSQADWLDYGVHSPASGPPRFVHVGMAVADLDEIIGRLEERRLQHRQVTSELGRQVYLNDPDGDPDLGQNVELVQYAACHPAVRKCA